MAHGLPFLEEGWEGGHDLSLSPLGKRGSVPESFDGNGSGVTMAHGLPLLAEGRGVDHDLSLFPLEN